MKTENYIERFQKLTPLRTHLGNGGATGLDTYDNYMGEKPDAEWRILYTRNRESETITESNWEILEETFKEDEEKGITIIRIGHWACGWVEYFCISEKATKEIRNQAGEIACSLDSYPILDEERYSKKEQEEADRIWSTCYDEKERISYIRDNRSQFEFHDFADLLAVARGKYFSGYANELIH